MLSSAARGTGGNAAGATSIACNVDAPCTLGAEVVLAIAYDNAGASGVDPFASISDALGNTWTERLNRTFTAGTPNDGVVLRVFTTNQDVAPLQPGTDVTVNFGAVSVAAKAFAFAETTCAPNASISYSAGATAPGAATASPSIATSALAEGQLLFGVGAAESPNTWAGDADSARGEWSAAQAAGFGSGAAGASVLLQRKLLTGNGTQSFDPTLTSADCIVAWFALAEVLDAAAAARPFGALSFGRTTLLRSATGRPIAADPASLTDANVPPALGVNCRGLDSIFVGLEIDGGSSPTMTFEVLIRDPEAPNGSRWKRLLLGAQDGVTTIAAPAAETTGALAAGGVNMAELRVRGADLVFFRCTATANESGTTGFRLVGRPGKRRAAA